MSSNPADPVTGRKPRAPLSITVRLALLYAVSASVLLLATTACLYWIHLQAVERDDVYFVLDKAHRLERALQENPHDLGFLAREVNWGAGFGELTRSHAFYSRILDGQGQPVIESAGMAAAVPVEQLPSPVNPGGGAEGDGVQLWRSPEGRTYYVLSMRARHPQDPRPWVIQVAMYDDAEDETMISTMQRAALAVLLLGALFSAGIGGVIARRGMKPLREIAAHAERITASQLGERIDPVRQPKELATLATALNRMLGHLESSFVRMSQFAADVAHELRTPIHNMRGEAEVALSREREPAEYRSILESSLEEFERLSRMINKMLFIARADDPERQIELVRLDARREIEAVREFFEALSELQGVTVSAEGQGEIDADPILLRRAITNVLSNALRHTPGGGQIVLSVENAGNSELLVNIADSGCGIRPERLPGICDRLRRADLADAQLSERNGLGLSIVKSIVELHGGSMAIDSALGKGTTVRMRFPSRQRQAA